MTKKIDPLESVELPEFPEAFDAAKAVEPKTRDCVPLHGHLTHEGKSYAPGEPVPLPADLAKDLIAAGHVAPVE